MKIDGRVSVRRRKNVGKLTVNRRQQSGMK
jgi:hypothetical protein